MKLVIAKDEEDFLEEVYTSRLSVRINPDKSFSGKTRLHTRIISDSSFSSARTKFDDIDKAFDVMEECAANLSHCNKLDDEKFETKISRIHYANGKWVCYTRERIIDGDNRHDDWLETSKPGWRTSTLLSYDELHTIDEAFDTLDGKICL